MIMFNSLTRENIHQIIDIELEKLYSRINDLGYSISITEGAKDFIVEKGYDSKFGARPLKRAIQKFIEDPLAESFDENTAAYLSIELHAIHPSRVPQNTSEMLADHISGLVFRRLPPSNQRRVV